jgi:hypothetical protein
MKYLAFSVSTKKKVAEATQLTYLRTLCRKYDSKESYRFYTENKTLIGTYNASLKKFTYASVKTKEKLKAKKYKIKTWYESRDKNGALIARASLLANVKHISKTLKGYSEYYLYYVSARREAKIAAFKHNELHYLEGYMKAIKYVNEEIQ